MDNKILTYKLNFCAKGSRQKGNAFINETKQLAKIANCIEIDFNYPHGQNFEKEINFLIKLQRDKGIQYTVHAPYFDEGINSFNEKIRFAILKDVFYSIDIAKKLKSKIVVLHPALEPYGLKINEREKLEMDSYNRISEYAESKDILIGLENEAQTCFWFPDRACKFQELEKTVRKINSKNFGYTIDIGHANVSEENFIEAIYKLKNKLFHIHFHDNFGKKEVNGRIDAHLSPGKGIIDWKKVIEALGEINYQNYVTIECDSQGINFLENKKMIE